MHTTGGYLVYVSYTHEMIFDYHKKDIFGAQLILVGLLDILMLYMAPYQTVRLLLCLKEYQISQIIVDFGRWLKNTKLIFFILLQLHFGHNERGNQFVESANLSSLKLLGTVGETIKEAEWNWYFEIVGKKQCPIVDTWWQTETGGF